MPIVRRFRSIAGRLRPIAKWFISFRLSKSCLKPRWISIVGRLASIDGLFSRNRDFLQRFAVFRQGNSMRLLNSGFTEFTPEDFFDKGTFIVAQLTGNTYYATTTPTLAAVQTQLDALDTALKMPPGLARDGAIATARPPLEQILQDLAENLEQATPGNLQKLSTTGFDL